MRVVYSNSWRTSPFKFKNGKKEYNATAFIRLKDHERIINGGVEIECQADGSNDPAKLEDGIFIPYRLLKKTRVLELGGRK